MSLFNSIWRDMEHGFRMGNMVRKLLMVNILVFVIVQIIHLVSNVAAGDMEGGYIIFWDVLHHICMPSDPKELLFHPWSPLTSIFLHEGFWHLVGNMIWLSMFGSIVGDLIGDRRVLPIYLLGGLAGNVLYFISAQIAPNLVGAHALGASAAVMAFGGAAIMLNADYRVALVFFGEVKIKYIILIMVLLDLVGVTGMPNAGGHAAHLGGFIFGVMFVYALRDRKDWSEPVNNLLDRVGGLFTRTARPLPKMKVTHSNVGKKKNGPGASPEALSHQERLDQILDKIKQRGFDQLTQEEKDFLYDASKK